MLFTSLEFLLLFLPIVLIVYFILPRDEDAWNVWLMMASLLFYAWGEPRFVIMMLISIAVNYSFARVIAGQAAGRGKRSCLIICVAINLGILFVFKYLNFTIRVLHGLLPFTVNFLPQTAIALPIGISFFTFQAMSYVVDVYRGTPVQTSFANFALYVSFFPQLIAGPIVRYTTVMREIEHRRVDWEGFYHGMTRFMVGFNKKVLLSNVFSEISERAFGMESLSVGMAWLGAIAYTLQIFFDFSGYSDMAIGLGEVFGFHFMENFNYPYISKTVTEFWRRWHISLGSWFRDYVYFPMGGSRVNSKWKLIRNLMTVWCLTGIWHGANWTFIVWGLLYGVLIVIEKLLDIPKKISSWPGLIRFGYRVFTMLTVVLGWVLFNSRNIGHGLAYIRQMFAFGGTLTDTQFMHDLIEYRVYLVLGLLFSTPLFSRIKARLCARGERAASVTELSVSFLQGLLFLGSVSCLIMNAHNPFIYFNF